MTGICPRFDYNLGSNTPLPPPQPGQRRGGTTYDALCLFKLSRLIVSNLHRSSGRSPEVVVHPVVDRSVGEGSPREGPCPGAVLAGPQPSPAVARLYRPATISADVIAPAKINSVERWRRRRQAGTSGDATDGPGGLEISVRKSSSPAIGASFVVVAAIVGVMFD